jgi:phage terminase small subunit
MFAQELAKEKTADEAYQLAGYTENRGNAARLKANESVTERVKELLAKAAQKHGVTADRLVMELCIGVGTAEQWPR